MPIYPPEKVDNASTCWAFLACSSEERHLNDIVFGVDVLRKRNVPNSNIIVFTNHPAAALHLGPYGIRSVFQPNQLQSQLGLLNGIRTIFVVVTGHGTEEGICDQASLRSPINASQLLSAVRSCPGVKRVAFVLGQCFAGVFNYIKADDDPYVCVIGGTNLHLSLSYRVELPQPLSKEDGKPGMQTWVANIFLQRFFLWLSAPKDIDGDGLLTLMDAYKYSGALSNTQLRDVKSKLHVQAAVYERRVMDIHPLAAGGDVTAELEFSALSQRLQETLEMLYLHQESWVLNARAVSSFEF